MCVCVYVCVCVCVLGERERERERERLNTFDSHQQLKEVFGAGTACVVCPVNRILYLDEVCYIHHHQYIHMCSNHIKLLQHSHVSAPILLS